MSFDLSECLGNLGASTILGFGMADVSLLHSAAVLAVLASGITAFPAIPRPHL